MSKLPTTTEILERIRIRTMNYTPEELSSRVDGNFYIRFTDGELDVATEKVTALRRETAAAPWPLTAAQWVMRSVYEGFLQDDVVAWGLGHGAQVSVKIIPYNTQSEGEDIMRVTVRGEKHIILFKLYFADRIFTPDPDRLS